MTSESSDIVGCLCQGFGNLSLASSKAKSSFIVVRHNMKPREGMQSGVVGRVLRSVSRRWEVSYQGSLGLAWPQVKLIGLWARVWSPVGWECCWGC